MAENKPMMLKSPELLPTTHKDRDLSTLSFTLLWTGMAIELSGFSGAAQMFPGLPAVDILLSSGLGLMLVAVLLVLTGDIGLTHGIPFTVYMRACFGYKGAIIPGILRIIPCLFWFGFQTWYAATGLNVIVGMVFGVSNLYVMIAIFGGVQIFNAAYGLKAMAKFDWIAIPLLAIVLALMTVWLFTSNDATFGTVFSAPSDHSISFSFALLAVAGGWITMAINSPDLTRKLKKDDRDDQAGFFRRNRKVITGQLVGLILTGSVLVFVGMVSGILTGEWNPIAVIEKSFTSSQPVVLALAFLAIAFAQWSTNTAANLMPPAYILVNMFPKLSFAKATIIGGVLGLIIMPWEFGNYLLEFQVVTSGLLGPITGIMICDYYLIRRRKLNVQELYKPGGQYTYTKNYNPAAIATLLISCVCSLFFRDYSFFVSFGLSLVLYYTSMKWIVLNKYEQNLGKTEAFSQDEAS